MHAFISCGNYLKTKIWRNTHVLIFLAGTNKNVKFWYVAIGDRLHGLRNVAQPQIQKTDEE